MHSFINQDKYPQEFAFHRQYAKSDELLDLVWTHCNIVADTAWQLIEQNQLQSQFDPALVLQSALLHDVGVYECDGFDWLPNQPPSIRPYAQHTVVGAWMLKQAGYHPEVVQTSLVHAGVGLTAEDIKSHGLDLPEENYLPQTPLQQIVSYSAKFHSKAPRFRTREEIIKNLEHHGPEKVTTFEEFEAAFGQPDIEQLQRKYLEWHKAFGFVIDKLTNPNSSVPVLSPAGLTQL